MAKQNNQIARKRKGLDAKQLDPNSLNVRELRGRTVGEELHIPPLDSHPQAQYMCMVQIKIQKLMVYPSHHLQVTQHQLVQSCHNQAPT